MNSGNCPYPPSCDEGSEQDNFLESKVTAGTQKCTLAYWHHSRYSSADTSGHRDVEKVSPFFESMLLTAGPGPGDIVVSGHTHNYEVFNKLNNNKQTGQSNSYVRQFVVGTGGKDGSYDFANVPSVSEFQSRPPPFGVLRLTLLDNQYAWKLLFEPGYSTEPRNSGGRVSCNA